MSALNYSESPESFSPKDYDRFISLGGECFHRFGNIFKLPIEPCPYTWMKRYYEALPEKGRVLDFGCGKAKPLLRNVGVPADLYDSCDSDPAGDFTFHSFDEVPADRGYCLIAANHVFEHLPFMDGVNAAGRLARLLAPGGVFLISVPSPVHPNRYLTNPLHVTPWNYMNLYALHKMSGLDPYYCARYNKTPGPRWYERPIVSIVCRVFRMDWCDSVFVVGRLDATKEGK